MITVEKFQGHIILYCKSHYNIREIDFMTGLRRIWGVRCGLNIEHISDRFDEYIADEMYRIIEIIKPKRIPNLWENIHKGLCDDWRFEGLTPIQRVIMIYRDEISQTRIKENVGDKWNVLVKLPKPQKRLFYRIVKGKGQYKDYELVK